VFERNGTPEILNSEGNSRKEVNASASFKPTARILLYGFVPSLCAQITDTGGVLPQPSSASAAGLQEARHSFSSMSDATQGLIMLDVVVT